MKNYGYQTCNQIHRHAKCQEIFIIFFFLFCRFYPLKYELQIGQTVTKQQDVCKMDLRCFGGNNTKLVKLTHSDVIVTPKKSWF